MKVLVFSPPFIGHFGVLKRMIHKYHQVEFKLAYTTWTNLLVEGEINLARSELKESLPANWTFPRVRELYEDCLNLAQESFYQMAFTRFLDDRKLKYSQIIV